MQALGLEIKDDWIFISSKRKGEAGVEGAEHLLSCKERPTAFFAAYDAIAFGAISRLTKAGLSIPEDISVVSYNDISLAKFASPPLTTLSTPVEDLTEAALDLLYKRIANPLAPYRSVFVQGELILRNSVKKIK